MTANLGASAGNETGIIAITITAHAVTPTEQHRPTELSFDSGAVHFVRCIKS
jgi:hypothetical protein